MHEPFPAPLRSLRVVDTTDGHSEMCARYLADLGAEVIRAEPPAGAGTRTAEPVHRGTSLREATRNANKLGVTVDERDLVRLLATADLWVTSGREELDVADLRRRLPRLVIASITDFGLSGPYEGFVGTEWVHAAMSGALSRSGPPGRPPLLPPTSVVEQATAAQASWCALTAVYHRENTGVGDHLDISLFETAAQVLDPFFGAVATADYGRPWWHFPRGRRDVAHYFPVFPCADGHVRICVLGVGQWRALREWMGEPEQFQDPQYDRVEQRQPAHEQLHPLIGALFADRTVAELTAEGQRRGVPIAPLLEIGDVPAVEHFRQRGAFTELEVAAGERATVPSGSVEIDGQRAGIRHRSPRLGEHDESVLDGLPPYPEAARHPEIGEQPEVARSHPFSGLRVLDLGVIVMGAETGRLFADLGAEVIKVENSKHPDGTRAPFNGEISPGFAWGQRNKRSLTVDLRDERGAAVFSELVRTADVLLSNFKPGTLEKMGFGADRLAELNPRLIIASSSAFGDSGPWRSWMGYGPLVRAATGLSSLWRDPDVPGGFPEALTIYPDHAVARIVATAALAALVERRSTGRGRRISCSQAETILTALSGEFAEESLRPGSVRPHGNTGRFDAPSGLYPCAGDDEWCVISVRGDDDYRRLRGVLDLPDLPSSADRVHHREELDALVAERTSALSGDEVLRLVGGAGVPAGPMRRAQDFPTEPALQQRRTFAALHQPRLPEPLPTEARQFHSDTIADALLNPAPVQGQHTREVCANVLGLSHERIDELVAEGVLEEPDPWSPLRSGDPEGG